MTFKKINFAVRLALFEATLLRRLGASAIRTARARCGSKTLRRSMELVQGEKRLKARVFVPHYWSVYYHQGRAAIRDKLMVWFKHPRLDPRNEGGYPVRANPQRRLSLSKEKFRELRKSGEIIVRKSVGPAPAAPFLDKCLTLEETERVSREELTRFLGELAFSEKSTARLRL